MSEQKDIVLSIRLTEDETTTAAVAALDLRGDHFEATGTARRNPDDPPSPLIGEELAIARALSKLQSKIMDAAQEKIDRYLTP
jgi:hypothetical protein